MSDVTKILSKVGILLFFTVIIFNCKLDAISVT